MLVWVFPFTKNIIGIYSIDETLGEILGIKNKEYLGLIPGVPKNKCVAICVHDGEGFKWTQISEEVKTITELKSLPPDTEITIETIFVKSKEEAATLDSSWQIPWEFLNETSVEGGIRKYKIKKQLTRAFKFRAGKGFYGTCAKLSLNNHSVGLRK